MLASATRLAAKNAAKRTTFLLSHRSVGVCRSTTAHLTTTTTASAVLASESSRYEQQHQQERLSLAGGIVAAAFASLLYAHDGRQGTSTSTRRTAQCCGIAGVVASKNAKNHDARYVNEAMIRTTGKALSCAVQAVLPSTQTHSFPRRIHSALRRSTYR